jgi:acetyl esterase/lipase
MMDQRSISRREFALFGAAALVTESIFGPIFSAAYAQAPATDSLRYVHPDLRAAVAAFQQRMSGFARPGSAPGAQPAARPGGAQAAPAGLLPSHMPLDWKEQIIKGRNGAPDVRIYVYGAKPGTSRPAILHMHGGGYIGGSPLISLGQLRPVAAAIDCVIVTVDYRLAPGTAFPGSLEDNYAALLWISKNAAELGVDRSRIAVMGESAGGGHAAMLAIAARDRSEVPIAFQALVYPMLDDRTGSTVQVAPPAGTLIWTAEANRRGWSALLGVAAGSAQVPAGAVPARIASVEGLPPAYIGVGSIDLFVDEDISYAKRLVDAGIPVELNVVPGAFHGFDIIAPNTEVTRLFIARLVESLKQALSRA